MVFLENKIPPLLFTVIIVFMMYLISAWLPYPGTIGHWGLLIAAICLLAGLFFCVAGVLSFKRASTTVDPRYPEKTSVLVQSGVYKFSRNPMYTGFALVLIAWNIWLASVWAAAGVLVFVLYMNRFQIIPEENALEEKFGEEYVHYRAAVRRWL